LLYEQYSQIYNSGQPILFGPIKLSKGSGIKYKMKGFSWDQVAQVCIKNGYIRIAKTDGGWFSDAIIQASEIPNLDVMYAMIQSVLNQMNDNIMLFSNIKKVPIPRDIFDN
jgi:hypothetical protein